MTQAAKDCKIKTPIVRRVFLIMLTSGLFLFTAFFGVFLVLLSTSRYLRIFDPYRPADLYDILLGFFPVALLVVPWVVYRLFNRSGKKFTITIQLIGAATIAIAGLGVTIVRLEGALHIWASWVSVDVQPLWAIAIVWTCLGLVWALSMERLWAQ